MRSTARSVQLLLAIGLIAAGPMSASAAWAPEAKLRVRGRITLTISPSAAGMAVGQTREFTALVTGTAHKNVRWRVCNGLGKACVTGGTAQVGTLEEIGRDQGGNPIVRYTAPNTVPSPPACEAAGEGCRVTIKARLLGRKPRTSTAIVAITPPAPPTLAIVPLDPVVALGGTLQFTAFVTGASPDSVVWQASAGTITSAGLYTAPTLFEATDTVQASLPGESETLTASTTVHLSPPPPAITELSPSTAQAGDEVHITGDGFYGNLTVEFPGPDGIVLDAPARSTSLTGAVVTVPHQAVSGTVLLISRLPDLLPMGSNSVAFTRIPRIRIRANARELSQGESTQIQVRFLGEETPRPLTWSAQQGTIAADGLYRAPASVDFDALDRVTACLEGTDTCDSLLLGLHHFRISPAAPLVKQSDTLRLVALQGGDPVTASWTQQAGGGELSPGGVYTAPASIESSGGIPVTASYHGRTQQGSVGVRGAFPGMIDRIADRIDFSQSTPEGTFVTTLEVTHERAYAVATNAATVAPGSSRFWLDIYDLTNPVRPVWIDAVESAGAPDAMFAYGNFLYQIADADISAGDPFPSTIAIYDVQNIHPRLRDRRIVPSLAPGFSFHEGLLYTRPRTFATLRSPLPVDLFDLRAGVVTQNRLDLPLPYPDRDALPASVTGAGNRIYLSFQQDLPGRGWVPMIGSYDTAANPPVLLGFVEGHGSSLQMTDPWLFAGPDVYDVSGATPVLLATIPGIVGIEDLQGSTVLARTAQTGLRVVDMIDPASPQVTAVLFDIVEPVRDARWLGPLVLQAQGGGGLAIFDGVGTGGLRRVKRLRSGGFDFSSVYDQRVAPPFLFAAGATDAGATVSVYDLRVHPAEPVGSYVDPLQTAFSLAPSGDVLFVGMSESVTALDVAKPSQPVAIGSYPLPTRCLALAGNVLFAGTFDDRLVVLDVTDPTSPQALGEVPLPGSPIVARASGTLLFVASAEAGLLVYDISTPPSPVLLSQFQPTPAVLDVTLDGPLALLAGAEGGFVIADVSDPSSPFIVGEVLLASPNPFVPLEGPASAISVAVRGGIAYVGTDGANGLVYGFDYRQPSHPRLVSLSAHGDVLETSVASFAFYDDDVFISGFLGGAEGISQEDASQPRNTINLFFPDEAQTLAPHRRMMDAGAGSKQGIGGRGRSNKQVRGAVTGK